MPKIIRQHKNSQTDAKKFQTSCKTFLRNSRSAQILWAGKKNPKFPQVTCIVWTIEH